MVRIDSDKIGIVTDSAFLLHDTGPGHPESPDRLKAVEEAISEISEETVELEAREASRQELLLVHTPEYVERILSLDPGGLIMLDADTAFSSHTKSAALKAVGGVLEAVDKIINGDFSRAFCAVRPPGHHAEAGRAMGFCIFNNIATGAAYALTKKDMHRVAIIDWDLHHGNGTQNIFYERDDVLYVSLHQYPHYPGSGSADDRGIGKGTGYTINIPMAAGSSDGEYREAFTAVIIPALTDFRPQMLFISAGFDAHRDDPLGGMNLSSEFYGEMTAMLRKVADEFCDGEVISVLEGGYGLSAIKESALFHLKELCK
ncbi:MAG: histone deacetylase [candidate division Zixibacteria bacterium]